MKNITLITCYFGEFPWYFNLFLKSCSTNPSVSFLIFSDCITKEFDLPGNVKILPFSLEEFNALAGKKLDFEINLKYAYKLCDLKPAYGVIFSDYLKNTDFWGITDIDIVFGRIRDFITLDLLETYDVISVRNDYPTGSFMLFKNNKICNELFMNSPDYQKVFQSEKHYCFDECNFKHNFLQEGGNINDVECEIDSMHHVIERESNKGNVAAYFDFLVIEGLPGQLKWDNGFLSFKNEFEVLLYHLILYKGNLYTTKKQWNEIPDIFFIDKYDIRKQNENSLQGFFIYYFQNKIKPAFKRLLFKTDFFISKFLNFNFFVLKESSYELNGMFFHLLYRNKKNKIAYSNKERGIDIFSSLFYFNSFYQYNFPYKRFSVNEKKSKIKTISIDGTIHTFQRLN
ncbi:hypothetical protein E0K83_12290 [Gramella sp. BOM4]|nr:hypothetical protein [Christiangramia bathymodioli]